MSKRGAIPAQGAALPVDDELALAHVVVRFGARDAVCTGAGRDRARRDLPAGSARRSANTFGRRRELVAAFGRLLRRPVGDDVVVHLVARRYLDELHRALAPFADWLDPDAGAPVVEGAVVLVIREPRSRCISPNPFGLVSKKEFVLHDVGLNSGRQMRSPPPVHIASPSLSWISGRQSVAVSGGRPSPYQYMLVSGAMPSRSMSLRMIELRSHADDGARVLASRRTCRRR